MDKICSKCNISKLLEEFHKDKSCKDGFRSWCKLCVSEYKKENKNKFRFYSQKYRENNKEIINAKRREKYQQNKEIEQERSRKYYQSKKARSDGGTE